MQISEVRLKKREGDSRFLASGSITFEGQFVVYPSWKNSDGEYKDVCFPMTKTLREDITTQVLAKYEEL